VKLVFITSTAWNGATIGSLANADALCTTAASNGSLPGTYKAFLSDGTGDAATRMTHSTDPYVLPNGTRVANNWADFIDGTHINGININESGLNATLGSLCGGTAQAFTGSLTNGTDLGDNCANWTSSAAGGPPRGAAGIWTSTNSGWSTSCPSECSQSGALYCVQQ
jgi:hypothetical protein